MESILNSIKVSIDIDVDDDAFDTDLIMHINSVFMDLTQIGVGPEEGYSIIDDNDKWTDFVQADLLKNLEAVKSYTSMRVKLIFDPPLSSTVIEAMNRQIDKWEWRLNHAVELLNLKREEENQNGV